ncbi:MAG: hypothetical protein WD273_06425 [Trueperaceae bacterium]
MSSAEDQPRRPGAPDDTDGKRRLRTVSTYPDPFLVTKLPQLAAVSNGIIRLGEKTILGFIHRPYPDGTRVQVVYDEWLFAERVEEEPEPEAAPEADPEAGPEAGPEADPEADPEAAPLAELEPEPKSVPKSAPAERSDATPEAAVEISGRQRQAGQRQSIPKADGAEDDPFPDDLTESDTPGSNKERDGKRDSWTDAFRQGGKDE